MARSSITVEIEGLQEFLRLTDRLSNQDAKRRFQTMLEKAGYDFLDLVQNNIIAMQVVDTRRLLNSFDPGDGGVWTLSDGGLTLTVGTNVEYARFVNDGHWTTPNGVAQRWVPGVWQGNKFTYNPSAETGMMLKRKFIQGRPYWDNAVNILESMFTDTFQDLVREWINEMGG